MKYWVPERDLTGRQRELLGHICSHFDAHGVYPSQRELVIYMGNRSTNTISGHMRALYRKGFLEQDASARSRSYRVLRLADGTPVRARLVPVVDDTASQEPT